jgi:hypothetical protein
VGGPGVLDFLIVPVLSVAELLGRAVAFTGPQAVTDQIVVYKWFAEIVWPKVRGRRPGGVVARS